jgi:rubrerythrin
MSELTVPIMGLRAILMYVCPVCRVSMRADLTAKPPKCPRCAAKAAKEAAHDR